jgi:ABC-type lipoprotein export system ATPase subunit
MSAPPVLAAESLEQRLGGAVIVTRASLSLTPGEALAIVGPSGCGKTTLLHMLGLLERPAAGRVLVRGLDAWNLPDAARARLRLRHIGFILQRSNLLPHLSARENVSLPAWRLEGARQPALAAAESLLVRFGLRRRVHSTARTLSLGEAQRVAIARALINRPAVVLADEPTGSLDSGAAAAVLEALDEIRVAGAALLLATHDASVAQRFPRVIEMQDGCLRAA